MKNRILVVLLLLFVSIFAAGCSQESESNKNAIETYLEKEFNGPNDQLSTILDQGPHSTELDEYLEENYGDIITDLDQFINSNYVLVFLRDAHFNGYQLGSKNINIQKTENTQSNLYDYEVEVEYRKDEQTSTTIVSGKINLDENGDISRIRKMDGQKLSEELNN
ncbi:hypothetical protein GCM10011351_19810 [Paraliobacillus quinghaiensis]|uniref:Uncharacterized protein n=2 Tax=Paraliobacillus quinghaiensis TaxID=470815 RepID=A0A917WVY1_9BACI|nr:hypothetical protein GCM10011351_19810 [Paraliobacillus quinghaiensis]